MQHFSHGDQILDRPRDVFDEHCGVHPMLVVKIDAVGFQPRERTFHHLLDVLWPAVESAGALEVETILCRDDDFVAERSERFSDQIFVGVRVMPFGNSQVCQFGTVLFEK